MSFESDQTCIIDAVQADVWLPQFVFNVLFVTYYVSIMG